MTQTETAQSKQRWRVLLLLLLAYILNFVDRQIIGVLAVPIKADLGLSDRQLGLMGGLAFVMFYTTMGLPIARLADRSGRVLIVSISVAVWSGFTALCGLMQNFWQLFAARMGVGIGEAGGVAPSFALISDYFPASHRARALAFFSLGVPIGSALGIFFGGWVASNIDWRTAFIAIGLVGIPVAWALWKYVPEPLRGSFDRRVDSPVPSLSEVTSVIARKPTFWLVTFGTGLGSIVSFGVMFWLPGLLSRSFAMPLSQLSWFYGSVMLVGGVAGTLFGGWLADRLGPSRPAAYALIPAICVLVAVPVYAAGLFAPSLVTLWIFLTVGQALGLMWLGPVLTSLQHLVAPTMRATISAAALFVNNLVGLGFGVYLVGELSTRMSASHGADSLRYSVLYILPFYAIAALLYFIAAIYIRRDIHETPATAALPSPA